MNAKSAPFFDDDGDNTAQALSTSAADLYCFHVYNTNAADAFVQIYDAKTTSITVGTSPPVFVMYVSAGGGVIQDFTIPLHFDTALSYACTTTATGNGDPTTGLTLSAAYRKTN